MALAVAAGLKVTAIHVDHGLRPDSALEAEIVRSAADAIGAQFQAVTLAVGQGSNLEARARQALPGHGTVPPVIRPDPRDRRQNGARFGVQDDRHGVAFAGLAEAVSPWAIGRA